MKQLRQDYRRGSVIRKIIPIAAISLSGILCIMLSNDFKSSEVVAQTVTKTEQKYINTEITPVIGESALASKEVEVSVEENTALLIQQLEALQKQLAEEKAKEAEAKRIAAEQAQQTKRTANIVPLVSKTNSKVALGTKQYPENTLKYSKMIQKYATMFGVDPNVIACLISQESSGNPNCVTATSVGIAQIDACLEEDFINFGRDYFGQTWDLDDRYNPAPSIAYCSYRISTYLQHYNGDYCKALQAYNFSHYSLDKLIEAFGEDWMNHTSEIAYYNGHYRRTGSTRYGDPNYVHNVLGFYQDIL